MKRFISMCIALTLSVCLAGGAQNVSVSAATLTDDKTTTTTCEYFDDGTYLVTTITMSPSSVDMNTSSTASTSSTRTGNKCSTLVNSDNEPLWSATVHGTFTYDGKTSKCTNASVSSYFSAEHWYYDSSYATKSGNTATGSVTGKFLLLGGIPTATRTITVSLSCDKNGNLS